MKNRFYIARDPDFPEGDVWIEMHGTSCGNPVLEVWGKNPDGPVKVICLSMAEACRLEKVLSEKFVPFSSAYLQRSDLESE